MISCIHINSICNVYLNLMLICNPFDTKVNLAFCYFAITVCLYKMSQQLNSFGIK